MPPFENFAQLSASCKTHQRLFSKKFDEVVNKTDFTLSCQYYLSKVDSINHFTVTTKDPNL
jgi:hypothetical protein